MNTRDPEQLDQALFGYSDGHRQIAASIRLPSKDMYNLAAASDLASGAKLGLDDSYLTGLPLAESRRYALIRTWPAPEMPRPGCVWSHVVLIDFRLLSSYGDLTDFLGLLKRPEEASLKFYGEPMSVGFSKVPHTTSDHQIVAELIRTYYSGRSVLLDSEVERTAIEAAIMAVWSQQWPRLRASFSFRTAVGGERRKSELINYDVQVGARAGYASDQDSGSVDVDRRGWVVAGAVDAAISQVTPLRRFLWRYGRDLLVPRKHYRTLVELFLETEKRSEVSAEEAFRIFDALPETGDGEILKRDILGIGAASAALCPPLPLTAFLGVLASDRVAPLPTEDEMRKRFDAIPAEQVGPVAAYLGLHEPALSRWEKVIDAGLVAAADLDALIGQLPDRVRKLILMSRPDLIDRDTIAALPNDGLLELASAHRADEIARTLASAIVLRDFGASNAKVFRSMPAVIFEAAVEAARRHELHSTWMQVISDNSAAVLETDWPARVQTTAELAIGLALLGFPRNTGKALEVWTDALSVMRDDVAGDDRIRLQAFLLRAALQKMTATTWKVAAHVLPELRPVILRGELPNDAYQMLLNDLPKFNSAAYWDINKRILIALSGLRQSFPDAEGLLALNLSEDDLNVVIYGADEEEERSKPRFWPWF